MVGDFSEGLADYRDGNRFGFCDEHGHTVLRASYRTASVFKEGLAAVAPHELYGFINRAGDCVIPPRFELADPFFEGKASVKLNGKYGFIHPNGAWLRAPDLDHADGFSDGLATGRIGDVSFYIDEKGQRIGPDFGECGSFLDDRAICWADGRYMIIDRAFKTVAVFSNVQWVGKSHRDGLVVIKRSLEYGFADTDGNIVVSPRFADANLFSKRRAAVSNGRKWALVAIEGRDIRPLTEFAYDEISSFREGFAVCRTGKTYRYLRETGELTASEFSLARAFFSGLAAVQALG